MSRPAPLFKSVPYWGLAIISLVLTFTGLWLVLNKIAAMEAGIVAGTATGIEVYGGQAWITLGGALTTAGLIGLVLTLGIAVVRSSTQRPDTGATATPAEAPVTAISADAESEPALAAESVPTAETAEATDSGEPTPTEEASSLENNVSDAEDSVSDEAAEPTSAR